ncbi:AfsR/SARP family transcriptional regulator [Gandjariella thermophila]|uniref:AfsR/SARP family transcriptional regulator n=1 Tax=Gandjariella thermophila TaxID=1931992 RepID=UPI00186449C2|nr:bacterial transcriptional activator domain-containing protein [Gandjariella thermophila]
MLLGRWDLRQNGRSIEVPPGCQRLLALLALRGRQLRRLVASTLWPETSDSHALGSLRSLLWRWGDDASLLLDDTRGQLALREGVTVDVHHMVSIMEDLLKADGSENGHLHWSHDISELAHTGDLLPGWYDDWVLFERERLRQMRLHSLEKLAGHMASQGQHAEAVEAALAAVAADPLRESAHRTVVEVHLAEGNVSEALRAFERCRQLMSEELGIEPSAQMQGLIAPFEHLLR